MAAGGAVCDEVSKPFWQPTPTPQADGAGSAGRLGECVRCPFRQLAHPIDQGVSRKPKLRGGTKSGVAACGDVIVAADLHREPQTEIFLVDAAERLARRATVEALDNQGGYVCEACDLRSDGQESGPARCGEAQMFVEVMMVGAADSRLQNVGRGCGAIGHTPAPVLGQQRCLTLRSGETVLAREVPLSPEMRGREPGVAAC